MRAGSDCGQLSSKEQKIFSLLQAAVEQIFTISVRLASLNTYFALEL